MLSWEPTGFPFKEENGTVEEEGPGSSDVPTPRSDALDPTSFALVSLTGSEGVREREAPNFEQSAEAISHFTRVRYVSSISYFGPLGSRFSKLLDISCLVMTRPFGF